MTNLSRMTTSDLVDAFGALKAEQAELSKREQDLKKMLSSRMRSGTALEGRLFRVVRVTAMTSRVDTKALKARFGEKFLEPFMKPGMRLSFRVNARVEEAA